MSEISFKNVNSWTIAQIRGPALSDPQLIERAANELSQHIALLPFRAMLLINFKGVEFISSQIIGLLLHAKSEVATKAGTLTLCCLSPKIREALEITGLVDQFSIAKSERAVVGEVKFTHSFRTPVEVGWLD